MGARPRANPSNNSGETEEVVNMTKTQNCCSKCTTFLGSCVSENLPVGFDVSVLDGVIFLVNVFDFSPQFEERFGTGHGVIN